MPACIVVIVAFRGSSLQSLASCFHWMSPGPICVTATIGWRVGVRVYVCTCVDLIRVGTCMQSELNPRPPGEAHATEVLSSQVKKSIGIIKQDQLLGLPWHRHALPYAF